MAIQENPYLPSASRVADAPEVEGGFVDGGQAVDAARGTHWLASGWRIFRAQPGTWILIGLVLVGVVLGLSFIPLLGHAAVSVLMPVFLGGLMTGCRKAENGNAVEVGDLFAGFQSSVGQLLLVGVIGLVLTVVVALPAILVLGVGAFYGATQMMGAGVLIGVLVFVALLIPVQMALWFAPALVVLQGMNAGQALGQSFRACIRNILPFLVYGVIFVLLAIVATLPIMLGWLVLGPVLIASVYSAYRDIFFKT